MRNALSFIVASAAAGYAAATLAAKSLTLVLLARYGHGLASGEADLGWLGCAILGSAALTAVVAAQRVEPRRAVSVFAFALSLFASLAVAGMTLACASAPLAGGVLVPADALAHATRWLFVGWLFAQVAVAGGWLVFYSHRDLELPRSTYSTEGYAALAQRPRAQV